MMKWIIAANSNQCRIYEYHRTLDAIDLLDEMDCPDNKIQTHNLVAGRPGRMSGGKASTSATYNQPHDPEEILIDSFAREIAHKLNHNRNKHAYDELYLIMPASMEGLLNHHLSEQVAPFIKKRIQKNVINLTEPKLRDFIKKNLKVS